MNRVDPKEWRVGGLYIYQAECLSWISGVVWTSRVSIRTGLVMVSFVQPRGKAPTSSLMHFCQFCCLVRKDALKRSNMSRNHSVI